MEKKQYVRRQLFVDRRTQFAMLAYSLLVALATMLLVMLFFLLMQTPMIENASRTEFYMILASLWFASVVILSYLGAVLSNRIAGPVYRLRQHMATIHQGGPIEPVKFRDGDHFSELAEDYNLVLDRLKRAEQSR
jgi:signal transduction histidine kinase